MRATQPGYRRLLGQGRSTCWRRSGWSGRCRTRSAGSRASRRDGRAGPVRAPAGHEHRLRRRADLPRPAARLPDGDRADPLVRQARLADARPPGPGRCASPGTCSGSRSSTEAVGRSAAEPGVMDRRRARPAGAGGPADRRDPRRSSSASARRWPSAGDTLGYDFLAYHQAADRLLDGAAAVRHVASPRPAGSGSSTTRRRSRRCSCRSGCCRRRRRPGPGSAYRWSVVRGRGRGPAGARARCAGGSCCWPGCRSRSSTRSSSARSGRSCSCCSRSAGAGSTTRSGSAASAALGAAIKLQPGLILVWALLTRRFRAVVVGGGRARRRSRSPRRSSPGPAPGPTS